MLDRFERASIVVLGSGTSVGVPMIGCHCKVCLSEDPRDKRLRPSILLKLDDARVLIDTSPDFRCQALRAGIERLDAILYTHAHADHILGLDDIRPFNFMQRDDIPIYSSAETLEVLKGTFSYVFDPRPSQSTRPRVATHLFSDGPIEIAGLKIEPIPACHGKLDVYGFRFGDCAYLTDHSEIPAASMQRLRDLDVLFLEALRHKPHTMHSTLEQSLKTLETLKPKRAFFTHISHELGQAAIEARLPQGVHLAYDGLEIPIGRSARL